MLMLLKKSIVYTKKANYVDIVVFR